MVVAAPGHRSTTAGPDSVILGHVQPRDSSTGKGRPSLEAQGSLLHRLR